MNLSYFIVMDPDSGTYFGAENAVLIDTRRLTPSELETLCEGCDSERGDLAAIHGQPLSEVLA